MHIYANTNTLGRKHLFVQSWYTVIYAEKANVTADGLDLQRAAKSDQFLMESQSHSKAKQANSHLRNAK